MTTTDNMTNMETTEVAASVAESAEVEAKAGEITAESVGKTSTLLESLLSSFSSSPFSKLLLSIRHVVGVRLPNTALLELPTVIEPETQGRLVDIADREGIMAAGKVILQSIDEINNGSLETVDKVIRKRLETAETMAGIARISKDSVALKELTNSATDTPIEARIDSN